MTSTPGLARRLGVGDAVMLGLGSMLGAGVFVVFAPATAAAGGTGMLVALALAGAVAFCNAASSARLAARYPESGGAYVYGRERLSPFFGFLAGWGFVVGKTASCAAMALAIGAYAAPRYAHPVAVGAVAVLTAVNLLGVTKTARVTRWLVAVTLAVLATAVVAGLASGRAGSVHDGQFRGTGVLTAAGLLFFAFAGYARVATLGEEVRDPVRTIPRAIPLALGIVLVVYLLVGATTLAVLGSARLAASSAPLADVAAVASGGAGGRNWLVFAVRAGAAIAVVGVLLALLAGVTRTAYAMARRRDLPAALATVGARHRVPHRAQVLVGVAVAALAVFGDLRGAIGFSSCTVLAYYAIANASALTLGRGNGGRGGLALQLAAGLGLAGCLVLALALPWRSLAAGAGVLAAGAAAYAVSAPRRRRA